MNRLYLDIGNSSYKLAEYKNGEWKILEKRNPDNGTPLRRAIDQMPGKTELIVSSVRREFEKQLLYNLQETTVRVLRSEDIPPERLHYRTPDTLGTDRFFSCLGATVFTRNAAIVVDAGSACTIDFISEKKVFEGGVILPGLQMIKQTLAASLPELPSVPEELPADWPGKSTEECLRWGIYGGYQYAIHAFVNRFLKKDPAADIFLTGGDAGTIKEPEDLKKKWIRNDYLQFYGMREFVREEDGFFLSTRENEKKP